MTNPIRKGGKHQVQQRYLTGCEKQGQQNRLDEEGGADIDDKGRAGRSTNTRTDTQLIRPPSQRTPAPLLCKPPACAQACKRRRTTAQQVRGSTTCHRSVRSASAGRGTQCPSRGPDAHDLRSPTSQRCNRPHAVQQRAQAGRLTRLWARSRPSPRMRCSWRRPRR
jgi:hypothetical protein